VRLEALEDRLAPAVDFWTGTAGNGLWSSGGNWISGGIAGVAPRNGDTLVFETNLTTTAYNTVDDLHNLVADHIVFDNGTAFTLPANSSFAQGGSARPGTAGYTISGNSSTGALVIKPAATTDGIQIVSGVNGANAVNNFTETFAASLPLNIGGTGAAFNSADPHTQLTINGTIATAFATRGQVLDVNVVNAAGVDNGGAPGVTLNGVISGNMALQKDGTGTLSLGAVNTFTGQFISPNIINSGVVIVAQSNSAGSGLGANSSGPNFAGTFVSGQAASTAGQLLLANGVTVNQLLTLSSNASGGGLSTSGQATWSGPVILGSTAAAAAQTMGATAASSRLTISGVISGGADTVNKPVQTNLTVEGNGTVEFQQNNTYFGLTTVGASDQPNTTLLIDTGGALGAGNTGGAGDDGTVVTTGSSLILPGNFAVADASGNAENLTLAETGVAGTGALQATLPGAAGTAVIGAPTLSGGNSGTLTLSGITTIGVNSGTLTVGVAIHTGGLIKSGPGQLILSGESDYAGGTTVMGGSLTVDGSLSGSVAVSPPSGSTATLNGTSIAPPNQLGSVGPTTINAGGILAPGRSTGILTVNGDTTFNAGSSFTVELAGPDFPTAPHPIAGTDYSQLQVTGQVSAAGTLPTLHVSVPSIFLVGTSFDIIHAANGVILPAGGALFQTPGGTTLTDNALFTTDDGQIFRINYTANDVVLTQVSPTTTVLVNSSGKAVVFGNPVVLTATVSDISSNATPAGTVEFDDFVNGQNTVLAANVALSGSGTVAAASFATTTLPSGPNIITAVFHPDPTSTFLPNQSAPLTQDVLAVTTTGVASSKDPSNFADAVTFTATITNTSSAVTAPLGSVEFFDGLVDLGLGSALVVSGNSATSTFTTSTLPVGVDDIIAVYAPAVGADFAGSQGSVLQTVNAITTSTMLGGVSPVLFGSQVNFTATVTDTATALAPLGDVEVFDGIVDLGPAAFSGASGNQATWMFSTTTLPSGPQAMKAVFSPSGSFLGSEGTFTPDVQAVSTTSVSSSLNPSTFGQGVTFTATITNTSSSPAPTGSVEFFSGGVDIGPGSLLAGSGNTATSTFTTSTLSAGIDNVKAVYTATGDFVGSQGSVSQTVKGITTTRVASSNNPQVFGHPVTFTITVTDTSSTTLTPTGSVELFDGTTDLGPASLLSGSGATITATFTTQALPSGLNNITAVYTPSGPFVGSQGSISQDIQPITNVVVSSSNNPSTFGQSATLTATITDTSNPVIAPLGTVEFFNGVTDLGPGTPLMGGGHTATFTFTTSTLPVGVDNITAVYTPTPGTDFVGSQGTLMQTVVPLVQPAILDSDGSLFLGSGAGSLLSPAGTILAASAAMDSSGFEHVFAIVKGFDAAGAANLWEYASGPNPSWTLRSVGHFQSVSAATNSAGKAVAFGILGEAGNDPKYQQTLWEFGTQFGGWTELSPGKFNAISAVTDSAGNDVVYAITADTNLWQHSPSGWVRLSTGSFQSVSAGLNGAGQAEVFAIVAGGSLWVNNPAFGQGDFSLNWALLSPAGASTPSTVLTITAAARNEVFAVDGNQALWQHTGAGWTLIDATHSWAQLSATVDPSGVDQVFGTLSDGSLLEYSPALPGNHFQPLPGGAAFSSAPRRPGF
jgi:autotransporter-associated beta strand protein